MSRFLLSLGLLWGLPLCSVVLAAESPEIQAAIDRGVEYLKTRIDDNQGGHKSLIALALLKAGVPKDAPELQAALQDVLSRFRDGEYRGVGGQTAIYTAGVDATFLVDVDARKYQDQLKQIGTYLLSQQFPNGAWDYRPYNNGVGGDTSVTQYACLGLWAVERAGVELDPKVWEQVLAWHTQSQNGDGGFVYTPNQNEGEHPGVSTLNMSVNGIGSMHIAMQQISPEFFPLKQRRQKTSKPAEKKKFGILQELGDETLTDQKKRGEIPDVAVAAVRRAFSWLSARFVPTNRDSKNFKAYYLYSLERMAALADVSEIGNHDWFRECSEVLLQSQQADGSWIFSNDKSGRDTAFCVLFLTRSTAKVLNRLPAAPGLGAGLLAGGRGLPDDLRAARYDGRQIVGKNQPVPPLEQLLASLQNTGEINLDQVQEQFVEQVQLGNREELIGQVDQLVKLARHPDAEVRRTAIWALGRSDRLDLGTILIEALSDRDLGVMIEARNALCWLSRKPNGFGHPEDPLADLPPDASEQLKQDAIATWHSQLVQDWGRWYLQVRPFDDRGDRFESELRRQIKSLQRQAVSKPE